MVLSPDVVLIVRVQCLCQVLVVLGAALALLVIEAACQLNLACHTAAST